MTKSGNSGRIDIALGFDERYAPHAAATIQSILSATRGADFRFTIIHDGVSAERRSGIERTAPKSTFHWVQIGDADIPSYASREHFSRAILFRLGLHMHLSATRRFHRGADSQTGRARQDGRRGFVHRQGMGGECSKHDYKDRCPDSKLFLKTFKPSPSNLQK